METFFSRTKTVGFLAALKNTEIRKKLSLSRSLHEITRILHQFVAHPIAACWLLFHANTRVVCMTDIRNICQWFLQLSNCSVLYKSGFSMKEIQKAEGSEIQRKTETLGRLTSLVSCLSSCHQQSTYHHIQLMISGRGKPLILSQKINSLLWITLILHFSKCDLPFRNM